MSGITAAVCCCGALTPCCPCPGRSPPFDCGCGSCTVDCNNPPAGLAGCCTKVFTITATMDGMLYGISSYSNWNLTDAMIADIIPGTGTLRSCVDCSGSCTYWMTPNDLYEETINYFCHFPGDVQRFAASPTNCSRASLPYGERYFPSLCYSGLNNCTRTPYMQMWKPNRFHGTFNASFVWATTPPNTRNMSVCNLSNYVTPASVQRLSATSDCGMTTASFDIVCKLADDGNHYFVVTLQWTPLMDVDVIGPLFGGSSCSGGTPPTVQTLNNQAWGTKFNTGSGFGGPDPVPTNLLVRYRIPVSTNPADQLCGIRLGTYAPYEIQGTQYASTSLGAFPSITIA